MTNDKIYASIVEMLHCYERETGRDDGSLDKLLSDAGRLHELAAFDACPNIYASAARVLVDLRDKMDKRATSAGRVNVCKRLVKDFTRRSELAGIHETDDGRYCILDGYRLYRFAADLPSIPRARVSFDAAAAIPKDATAGGPLPAPSKADIKAYIAETGQTRRKPTEPYTPAGWPAWYAVNPYYLLDALDAMPNAVYYAPASYNKPLYFADADGNDGIILPVCNARVRAAWQEHQINKAGGAA